MILSNLTSHLKLPGIDRLGQDLAVEDVLPAVILLTFAVLMAAEVRLGRGGRANPSVRKSYRTNLSLFLFNDLLMSALSVSSLLILAERHTGGGLLAGVSNPWLRGLLALLLLDLVLYCWHWASHRLSWLWLFHKVHHSDRSMNVTTGFRLHFAEVLLTVLVKAGFIVITGVHAAQVLLSEALITLAVLFHHADVSFPGERRLGRLFVVPSLHRVHHSALRSEHDRNYGALFSFWDRLFGTLLEVRPAQIGLREVDALGFVETLKFGFTYAYGSTPLPLRLHSGQSLEPMIAEAAYFRAEKRGFMPGFEMFDWLAAEREIEERMNVGRINVGTARRTP
ncbi:sterol desaturase family protein [Methylococcus capsulatus]|uniref:sterol desaturase family protein n=1 Tax=Methylococcus capsulatus TaxID=414 RepID=UPI002FDA628B